MDEHVQNSGDGKGGSVRAIRVFVSSTFRDMKAERDELVLRVFPQLRKLCAQRSVSWSEVDLRWGITDEQAAEGKVLPLCLEQINRCRPYFIGLLGERYGWINAAYPEHLIRKEPWLREHVKERKSITELEILYGVLNHPDMANRAFFYFRDPGYVDRLPAGANRDDYTSADAAERSEVERLKGDIIRASERGGCTLRKDGFRDGKELGKWLLQDFTALIDRLYPEQETPDEMERIRLEHDAVARSKTGVYIARQSYFDRLDDFASSRDRSAQPLVVLGDSGLGKSALLANWVEQWRKRQPDDLVILHFVGATSTSAEHTILLRRFMFELSSHFGWTDEVPLEQDAILTTFPDWLARASGQGSTIIVIAALDQIEDSHNAQQLEWLPIDYPTNVRLIVSTLPGPVLDSIRSRGWMTETEPLRVQPLTNAERRAMLLCSLRAMGRELDQPRLERLVAAEQTSSPLFMRAMLEELRVMGEHEKLGEQIDAYLTAAEPKELYRKILRRWVDVYSEQKDLVAQTLRFIWASKDGLSESELLGLLGSSDQQLPQAHLTPLLLATESAMVIRSGLMSFGHAFVRQAVADELCQDGEELRRIRYRMASFFANGLHMPDRCLAEQPWQLAKGGYSTELQDFLLSPIMLRMVRSSRAFDEARRYWMSLERREDTGARIRRAFESMIHEKPEPASEGLIANALSHLLSDLGFPVESLWFNNRAENYFRANASTTEFEQIAILSNRAATLIQAGRLDKAVAIQDDILDRAQAQGLRDDDAVLTVASNRAHVFHIMGELERAHELYQDTARRTARKYGKRHPKYIKRRGDELCLAMELGHDDVRESELRDLISDARAVLGPAHETTLVCMHNLGAFFETAGDLRQSVDVFSEMLSSVEAAEGEDALPTLQVMVSCARVRSKLQQHATSDALHSTGFARARRRHGPLHPVTLECLESWVASTLNRRIDGDLEGPFGTVLRAFVLHERQSGKRHSQHDSLLRLFLIYLEHNGVASGDIPGVYRRVLELEC